MAENLDDLLASLDPEYYKQAQGFRVPGVSEMSPMSNPDVPIQVPPPIAKTPQRAPAVMAPQAAPEAQSPSAIVEPYIKKKFDLGEYSDENRKALIEKNGEYDLGGRLSAAAAALGAGLMGGNAAGAGSGMLERMDAEKKGKLDAFDKGRSGLVEKFNLDEAANKVGLEDADLAALMDPNSAASKSFQSLAKKIDPSKDYSGVSGYELRKTYPQMEKLYDIDQRRLEKIDNRNFQERLFRLKDDEKDQVRQEKRDQRNLELAVPGYERTGEVMPKTEEAMKLRKATASAEQLKSKLGRLKELVKQNGSYEYGGQGGQEMESLATEIQLLSKSPEMYELGVLTGPDMNLLQKITADPTSMASLFTRDSTRQKQIDAQLSSIEGKLSSTAKSMGYRSAGRAPQGSGERTVVKKQVNKKTGQTKLIYSDGSEEIQ